MAVVFGLGLLTAPPALADDCTNGEAEVDVRLDVNQGNVVIDHTRSQQDIGAMVSDSPDISGGQGRWNRVGLTHAMFQMGTRASMRMIRAPGETSHCVSIDTLTLELGFPRLVIYIPRTYSKSSCAYREILEHEHEHVAAHRRTLERFRSEFRRAGRQAMARLSPFRAATQEEAQTKVNNALSGGLDDVMEEFRLVQREANTALDTAKEYRAIQRRCQDW